MLKELDRAGRKYVTAPIRETPPTRAELRKMLGAYQGQIRKLFNTSGLEYKSLGMKDKLSKMSEKEAIELLSTNGRLVKRPFVISAAENWVGYRDLKD